MDRTLIATHCHIDDPFDVLDLWDLSSFLYFRVSRRPSVQGTFLSLQLLIHNSINELDLVDFDCPLHLSDDLHISLSLNMHVYHSVKILTLRKLPPSPFVSGWLVLGVASCQLFVHKAPNNEKGHTGSVGHAQFFGAFLEQRQCHH